MQRFLLRLLLIFFFTLPTYCYAQLDSLVWGVEKIHVDTASYKDLSVTIETMPFVKDNEYKGNYVKGYTLPGVWLQPRISYQPLKNLRLEIGAHLLHFWGAEKYPNFNYSRLTNWQGRNVQDGFHCVPIVRAHLQLTPTLNIVIGTLYGKSNHSLVEPLYNDELNLSSDPETGVQIVWNSNHLLFDTWVNWESFIFKNDKEQESFTFGLSSRFCLSLHKRRSQWYVPLQMIFQHRGGEINTQAEDRIVKTWVNAAVGVGVNVPLATKMPITMNFETTSCYYGQQAGTLIPFKKGYGIYAKATAHLWHITTSLGYWYCHDYVSIHGNPLFGAIGIDEDNLLFKNPQMLTAHAELTQKLGKGFAWGVALDVFHHFNTKGETNQSITYTQSKSCTCFSAGLYLRACPSFLIKRFE